MSFKSLVYFIIILFLIFTLLYGQEINESNWESHPKIKEIRKIYSEIYSNINTGKYNEEEVSCEKFGGSEFISGTIYKDENGVIRKYELSGGSGDTSGAAEYYYSEKGTIRFAFLQFKAHNGTERETRIYYDVNGNHLYTDSKGEGPGYAGGWDETIENPLDDFKNLCLE